MQSPPTRSLIHRYIHPLITLTHPFASYLPQISSNYDGGPSFFSLFVTTRWSFESVVACSLCLMPGTTKKKDRIFSRQITRKTLASSSDIVVVSCFHLPPSRSRSLIIRAMRESHYSGAPLYSTVSK